MEQLGTPTVNVSTEHGADLSYGCIEEIGYHWPELRVDRDLHIYDIAING